MAGEEQRILEQALAQLDAQIAARDPYSGFGSIADQIGQAAISQSGKAGLGEILGASLISGLLGGKLGQMGQTFQIERGLEGQNILSNMALGLPAPAQGNLSENLYKKAKGYGELVQANRVLKLLDEQRQAGQALNLEQKKQEFASERDKLKAIMENPGRALKALDLMDKLESGSPIGSLLKETTSQPMTIPGLREDTPQAKIAATATPCYSVGRCWMATVREEARGFLTSG